MAVSKVSIDEINDARHSVPAKKTETRKQSYISQEECYVDRLTDKKIANFFAPYGYVFHERNDKDKSIWVLCNDCQILFNDFSLIADHSNILNNDNNEFDFVEFSILCEQANTTPSQAIQDRLEDEIFNGMPYYVERKKKFTEENLQNIAANKKYGKLMQANTQKQQHRENLASLNKTYGDSDPEKIADTLARLNPNK